MTDTPRAVTVSRPLPSTSSPRNRARTRPGEERRGDADMLRVAIIVGSTRPGRKGEAGARRGYENAGGTRAVEHLRLVMGELMVADVRAQVALSLHTDFENFSVFKPAPHHEKSLHDVLDQVIAWGGALRSLRRQ